jgi:hypothetical protein
MGTIEDIFAKPGNKIQLGDIQQLIDNKKEETRNLEYKAPQFVEKPVALSEWVSAFLNSDGGLIILGVCESDPTKKNNINPKIYPTQIDFVDNRYTKESIEQIIFSNINCTSKPNIKIYPIRDSSDSSKAVYLIDIPQGDNPPYQAQNKKYYRKLNATKYELPHSEIADFFGRRFKPKLILNCMVTNPQSFDESMLKKAAESGAAGVLKHRVLYNLQFIVSNIGKTSAKYARVTISFENIGIEKILIGQNRRIDQLRNGIPTLQWDYPAGIIYQGAESGEVIWELQVRLQKNKMGIISWHALADEMDAQEGRLVLSGIETANQKDEIKPYFLQTYEYFWSNKETATELAAE